MKKNIFLQKRVTVIDAPLKISYSRPSNRKSITNKKPYENGHYEVGRRCVLWTIYLLIGISGNIFATDTFNHFPETENSADNLSLTDTKLYDCIDRVIDERIGDNTDVDNDYLPGEVAFATIDYASNSETDTVIVNSDNNNALCKEDLLFLSTLEAVISIWKDQSGSVAGIVPDLTFGHLEPLLDVFSQLNAASMSVGSIGNNTREDMAFLTFNSSRSRSIPKRKDGERPADFQKRLIAFKKRQKRKIKGTSFESKIVKFEKEARSILSAPKNQGSSLICEALNVSKRQINQSNVDDTTQKFVLVLSDMLANGSEPCPLTLGDAELIIVNRLSNPSDLLLHKNTHHFISVEEAIDFIVNNI